eukprot:SAG11_NODE_25304_length_360_cov_2.191571_1_plen_20_part_10
MNTWIQREKQKSDCWSPIGR